jgi:hypothetical protein
MKYLLLIVRHFFPRRRWETVRKVEVFDVAVSKKTPTAFITIQQDQFGNLRKFKY